MNVTLSDDLKALAVSLLETNENLYIYPDGKKVMVATCVGKGNSGSRYFAEGEEGREAFEPFVEHMKACRKLVKRPKIDIMSYQIARTPTAEVKEEGVMLVIQLVEYGANISKTSFYYEVFPDGRIDASFWFSDSAKNCADMMPVQIIEMVKNPWAALNIPSVGLWEKTVTNFGFKPKITIPEDEWDNIIAEFTMLPIDESATIAQAA